MSKFLGSTRTLSNGSSFIGSTSAPPPAPTVSAVVPKFASAAGNWTTTLTGSGFTGATSVTIGGQSASFVINNSSKITITTPAWTTPNGTSIGQDIVVSNAGGSGTLHSSFYFLPSNNSIVMAHSSDTGITLSGPSVSSWADISGNNNTWSGGVSPTYQTSGFGTNSLPYLSFDGSTQWLEMNGVTNPIANAFVSLYIVGQYATVPSVGEPFVMMDAGNVRGFGLVAESGTGNFYVTDEFAGFFQVATADTDPHVFGFSATRYTTPNPGTGSVDSTIVTGQVYTSEADTDNFGAGRNSLGANNSSGTPTQFTEFNITADLVYSQVLSTADDITVRAIFKAISGTP